MTGVRGDLSAGAVAFHGAELLNKCLPIPTDATPACVTALASETMEPQ